MSRPNVSIVYTDTNGKDNIVTESTLDVNKNSSIKEKVLDSTNHNVTQVTTYVPQVTVEK